MTYFYCIIAAFLVGFGVAYGFRGWLAHNKEKIAQEIKDKL